jgi:hypothetical protein
MDKEPKFCSEGLEVDIESDDIGLSTLDACVAHTILEGVANGNDMSSMGDEAKALAKKLERLLLDKLGDDQVEG